MRRLFYQKKVRGGLVTITHLAQEWLLRSCKILQMPYSSDAYALALKEAEQFLWAGSEMDPVHPIMLDVGTNNEKLLEDRLYLGLREQRLEGDEYISIVDELMEALHTRWPKAVIQPCRRSLKIFNSSGLLKLFKDTERSTACSMMTYRELRVLH